MGFLNFRRGRKDLPPIILHSQFLENSTDSNVLARPAKTKLLRQFSQHVGSASCASGWAVPEIISSHIEDYSYSDSTSTMGHSLRSGLDVDEDLLHYGYSLRGGSISDFEDCDPNSPTALAKYLHWIEPDFSQQQTDQQDIQWSPQQSHPGPPNSTASNGHASDESFRLDPYPDVRYRQPSVDDTENGEDADDWSNSMPGMVLEESYAQSQPNGIAEWVDNVPFPADNEYVVERILAARAHIPPLSPPPYIQPQSRDNFEIDSYSDTSSESDFYHTESIKSRAARLGPRYNEQVSTMCTNPEYSAESGLSGRNQDSAAMCTAPNPCEERFDDDWIVALDDFNLETQGVLSIDTTPSPSVYVAFEIGDITTAGTPLATYSPFVEFPCSPYLDWPHDRHSISQVVENMSDAPLSPNNIARIGFNNALFFLSNTFDDMYPREEDDDNQKVLRNNHTFEFGNGTPFDFTYKFLPSFLDYTLVLEPDAPLPGCLYCDHTDCTNCTAQGCPTCTHDEEHSGEFDELARECFDLALELYDMAYGDDNMAYRDNNVVCSDHEVS